ncbi:L-threonylcarbamoyladenylate synthase [Thermodesulfobacteriota bacterium]
MEGLIEKPHIIRVDTEDNLRAGLSKAKGILLSGGIVAFPTESFYGLAVNSTDEKAIRRLFTIKRRESDHPVLILIPNLDALDLYVDQVPKNTLKLIDQFWPGGLTLVFKAGPNVSPLLTAGTGKIGIRLSSHSVATSLAQSIGLPITGTSANITGQPACINAQEVYNSLGHRVDLILDGGETAGGKGSTILDVSVTPPVIMREGMISRDRLRQLIDLTDFC